MSGHNKWSKIKHKKAATDAQKSKLFSKYASLIALESKRAGGNVNSPGLLAVIERAKRESMPKENIERAVLRGSGADGSTITEVVYETYGPGGTAIVITAVTNNTNRTTPEVRHSISKLGYQLGVVGSALWAFDKSAEGYKPKNITALSEEDGEKLAVLIEELESHEDVQDIYTTADDE